MRKILVLGSSGSGKSTFSRQLGKALEIEVIHLDSYYWKPDWMPTPEGEWAEKLDDLLQGTSWVMDGNYPASLPLRLSFSAAAAFLDVNRWVCLWRCVKRLIGNWGRNRQELAPGCYEKMDGEFFLWIWNYPKNLKPSILDQLSKQTEGKQIIILRNNREITNFFKRVKLAEDH
jgi:adenylate kinase family enzyme